MDKKLWKSSLISSNCFNDSEFCEFCEFNPCGQNSKVSPKNSIHSVHSKYILICNVLYQFNSICILCILSSLRFIWLESGETEVENHDRMILHVQNHLQVETILRQSFKNLNISTCFQSASKKNDSKLCFWNLKAMYSHDFICILQSST